MNPRTRAAAFALLLALGVAAPGASQVERIELDIAGYLCGFWVFNVKAAVSRLEFGPKPKQMEVTDIATGHFVFAPVAEKPVAFATLDAAIRAAGYEIESASLTVVGTIREGGRLEVAETAQSFRLVPGELSPEDLRAKVAEASGDAVRVVGAWSTDAEVETIEVARLERSAGTSP